MSALPTLPTLPAWEDLVSLAHCRLRTGDVLTDAMARDIARYRLTVTTANGSAPGNIVLTNIFIATGETHAYLYVIADTLWSYSEVKELTARDEVVYRMFIEYLKSRMPTLPKGDPSPGPVDGWATLTIDSE